MTRAPHFLPRLTSSSLARRLPRILPPALGLALLCGAGLFTAGQAVAADYPSQPVRLVVPFAPGGSSDALARLIGQELGSRLGQPVIVDNKPGAGTTVGSAEVARATADGQTLLLAAAPFAIAPALFKNLSYTPDSFRGVALISTTSLVLTVSPSVPADDVDTLVALARKEPQRFSYASPGNGTLPHLAAELFKARNGVTLTHVPYKGAGPAVTDLMGGFVQLMFASPIEVTQGVASGRLKYIKTRDGQPAGPEALASGQKSSGPAQATVAWFGIVAPRATPDAVVRRLSDDIGRILAQPSVRKTFEAQGADVAFKDYAAFDRFIAAERIKWSGVVRSSGVTLD